ncbi:DnaA ATPase domain-containing protein, partial [Thermodesulfobacteriota bacterium]
MTIENRMWELVTESLRSKLSESEIKTWFSQTTLNRLDNNLAIIEVPNKFIANWLRDNYLKDIKGSLKAITKEVPEIQFQSIQKSASRLPQKLKKDEKPDSYFNNNLNKSMDFDNFVTGEFNRFAFSSAVEISNRPGDYYNPLYIYSKLSIGKTHLLNAIGNHILNSDRSAKVGYVYSKTFIS